MSILFFGLGLFFIITNTIYYFTVDGFDLNSKQVGYFFTTVFGASACILFLKINDKNPKLILHKFGITDEVGKMEIYWKDIIKLSVYETHGSRFLKINVHNPQEYLDNQTNGLNRKAMWLNNKVHGTPILLSTSSLDISFEELMDIINKKCRLENKVEI